MAAPETTTAEGWPRIVLHADMDAFYAAVEQLDRPELRGKPLLIGSRSRRGVVATASYEARPFGVGSAMPMAVALRRCPDAIVVPPRMARYAAVSRTVMEVLRGFSPILEPLSLDEASLEMTGTERLWGGPTEMGRRVKRAVFEATGGLTVSVGVSTSRFVAKVASDQHKPDGLTVVPPDEITAFLAPMSVGRLIGVGARTRERLERLGFVHIADIADADPRLLRKLLGRLGPHLHALAHGRDARRIEPGRGAKSVGWETTLEADVRGREAIWPWLQRGADEVAARLRRHGLVACGVRVKLKRADFQLETRQRALREPTASADVMLGAADGLLDAFDLQAPRRLIGVAAFDLQPADTALRGAGRRAGRPAGASQLDLFSPRGASAAAQEAPAARPALDAAIDALEARFGRGAVQRASTLGRSRTTGLADAREIRDGDAPGRSGPGDPPS